MIIPEEQFPDYIGRTDRGLPNRFPQRIVKRMMEIEEAQGVPFSEYLLRRHHKDKKPVVEIAQEVGVGVTAIERLFEFYEIPKMTSPEIQSFLFQTPEHREKVRKRREERNKDPEYVKRRSETNRRVARNNWSNPEYAAARSRASKRMWEDPEYRKMMSDKLSDAGRNRAYSPEETLRRSEHMRKQHQDPEFEQGRINAIKSSDAIKTRWNDPEKKRRHTAAMRALHADPEFEARRVAASRRARADPANQGRYSLPTIHGERSDIGYAKSSFEANIARVFALLNRAYTTNEVFSLEVPGKYKELFPDGQTYFYMDFKTLNPNGKTICYEIMVPPYDSSTRFAKIDMLKRQYLGMDIRVINEEMYERLERTFRERINNSSGLIGWEAYHDNLRTNPEKYGLSRPLPS